MSEEICYIYVFAQIKMAMYDFRQSIWLWRFFRFCSIKDWFSVVSQFMAPAGGLCYGSIVAGSGRSKKCYGYAF